MAEINPTDAIPATNASNTTRYYNLPLFIATDKPSWLVDWNGAMNEIDSILQDINNSASGAESDVETVVTQVNQLSGVVSNLESIVNTAVSDVAKMQTTVDSHGERMDSIEADLITQNNLIKSLSDAVTTMQATVSTLNNRIQAVETTVEGYNARITSAEQASQSAIDAVEEMQTTISTITNSINSINSSITTINNTLSNLNNVYLPRNLVEFYPTRLSGGVPTNRWATGSSVQIQNTQTLIFDVNTPNTYRINIKNDATPKTITCSYVTDDFDVSEIDNFTVSQLLFQISLQANEEYIDDYVLNGNGKIYASIGSGTGSATGQILSRR